MQTSILSGISRCVCRYAI